MKNIDEFAYGGIVFNDEEQVLMRSQGFISKGELISSNEESAELQFFNLDKVPELFNQQHIDAFNDFRTQKVGVFR